MSEVDSTQWYVYTGFWHNQSKGALLGWTLTTHSDTGLVLVAAIGIFVSLLSGHIWGILCYALHQWRCNRDPHDGLYHQQQALLANAVEPTASVWQLIKMGSAWEGRATHSRRRVIPLTVIAALMVVAFNLAGIFSSNINNQLDEVLIRGPSCGYQRGSKESNFSDFNVQDWKLTAAQITEQTTTAKWSKNYQKACYGKHKDPSVDCNFFAVPSIDSKRKEVDCPFDDKICLISSGGAVEMETRLFSSGELGMNAKPDNEAYFRKRLTCAPIKTEGYSGWVPTTDASEAALPGILYYEYFYGSYSGWDNNVSFGYNTYEGNGSLIAYPATAVQSFPNSPSGNTWDPIPELNRTDADVTLIYLITNVLYIEPVNDPWFNATVKIEDALGFDETLYQNPDPGIVMGCTEQYQFCNSKNENGLCSPFTGLWTLWDWGYENVVAGNLPNDTKLDIAANILKSLSNNNVGNMIFALNSDAVAASDYLVESTSMVSAPLPEGSWQSEVHNWHDYTMAMLQRQLVSIATGPWRQSSAAYVESPDALLYTTHWHICDQMKIRDSRYYSFSCLGLGITLLGGLGFMALNIFLPTFIGYLQRHVFKSRRGMEMREDWMLDGLFQLQRMAFEGAKLGTWARRVDHDIPVTLKGNDFKDERFLKPHRTVSSYEEVEMEPPPSLGYGNDQHSLRNNSMGAEDLRKSVYSEEFGSVSDYTSLVEHASWPQTAYQRDFV